MPSVICIYKPKPYDFECFEWQMKTKTNARYKAKQKHAHRMSPPNTGSLLCVSCRSNGSDKESKDACKRSIGYGGSNGREWGDAMCTYKVNVCMRHKSSRKHLRDMVDARRLRLRVLASLWQRPTARCALNWKVGGKGHRTQACVSDRAAERLQCFSA